MHRASNRSHYRTQDAARGRALHQSRFPSLDGSASDAGRERKVKAMDKEFLNELGTEEEFGFAMGNGKSVTQTPAHRALAAECRLQHGWDYVFFDDDFAYAVIGDGEVLKMGLPDNMKDALARGELPSGSFEFLALDS